MENKTVKRGSGAIKLVNRSAKLVALTAAAYFFFGPKGDEHRENAKDWAVKMKADVVKRLRTAHDISEFAYHKIIDSVAARHAKGKKAAPQEIKALAQELKKHWKKISAPVAGAKRKVAKAAKKVAKKPKNNKK